VTDSGHPFTTEHPPSVKPEAATRSTACLATSRCLQVDKNVPQEDCDDCLSDKRPRRSLPVSSAVEGGRGQEPEGGESRSRGHASEGQTALHPCRNSTVIHTFFETHHDARPPTTSAALRCLTSSEEMGCDDNGGHTALCPGRILSAV
jgi:hypothetical protein